MATAGRRGRTEIVFPERGNFEADRDATVYALREFRTACLESASKSVFLDLRRLVSISEPVAVVLVAEIERCVLLCVNKEILGNFPDLSSDAYTVLQGLGAFRFLSIKAPERPLRQVDKGWYHIFSDREADGDKLGDLQDYFQPYVDRFLGADARWDRQFYKAMLDAASNTLEHAYDPPGKNPWIIGRWWAAGLVDDKRSSICFVFWDQGQGIPRTMRRKIQDALQSDSDLITRALETGFSRHRSNKRRGHGLSELLHLLTLSPDGEFSIHSGRASIKRTKIGEVSAARYDSDIQGTLLEWTVSRAQP